MYQMFSVHSAREEFKNAHFIFKFLQFEERFQKAPFSWRISVNGTPNGRNKAAFPNSSDGLRTGANECTKIYDAGQELLLWINLFFGNLSFAVMDCLNSWFLHSLQSLIPHTSVNNF